MDSTITIVTANCRSPQQAQDLAEKYMDLRGVVDVEVDGCDILFTCDTASDQALTTYGRIQDALPFSCSCSVTPVSEEELVEEA